MPNRPFPSWLTMGWESTSSVRGLWRPVFCPTWNQKSIPDVSIHWKALRRWWWRTTAVWSELTRLSSQERDAWQTKTMNLTPKCRNICIGDRFRTVNVIIVISLQGWCCCQGLPCSCERWEQEWRSSDGWAWGCSFCYLSSTGQRHSIDSSQSRVANQLLPLTLAYPSEPLRKLMDFYSGVKLLPELKLLSGLPGKVFKENPPISS